MRALILIPLLFAPAALAISGFLETCKNSKLDSGGVDLYTDCPNDENAYMETYISLQACVGNSGGKLVKTVLGMRMWLCSVGDEAYARTVADTTSCNGSGEALYSLLSSYSKTMGDFTKTPRPFYPSLSSQNREIRLLHLQPGAVAEELQCRLSVISLDSNPSYEALSYRWGNDTTSVLVDGHWALVTKILDEALYKLRLDDKERVLWADAICIDQSRITKRNDQIALMADIYSKCERCLICLGNAGAVDDITDSYSRNLPELLAALSKKHHLNQPEAPRINPMFGATNLPLIFLNLAGWWKRIWVVQEVILAPQSLVLFGSLEMLFSDIVKAVEFINEHDIGSAWNSDSHETDKLCHCMDRMKVTFIWESLYALRDHIYGLLELTTYQPETGSIPVSSEPTVHRHSPDIIDVLLSVWHRDSTDPRDKIFGILSLVQELGSWGPIKADYSKDALQVFSKFATQMIQSQYGLKTLLLARGTASPPLALTGLPTWLPDWTKKGSEYEQHLITVERHASRSHNGQSASILGSTLALRCGLSMEKIAKLSTAGAPFHGSYGQAPSMESFDRFTQMFDSWRMFAGGRNILTLGGVLDRHPSSREDIEETENLVESGSYARLMTEIERSEYTVEFMPQILAYLPWRYFEIPRRPTTNGS